MVNLKKQNIFKAEVGSSFDHKSDFSFAQTRSRTRDLFLSFAASTFNSLNTTNFFSQLEKLSLCIQMTSGSIDRLHLELTFAILISIGKIKYLKLNGISSLDSKLIMNLATSCKNLETLVSDCQLTNAQQVIIYRERQESLKHLKVDSSNSWDEAIFQSLSECSKMEKLTDYIYPFFKGLDKMKNLRAIHLEFCPHQSLDDFIDTFTEGSMPQIESIGLTTSTNEDKIYPLVARCCPNLRVLYMCTTNPAIKLETLRDMVYKYNKLEIMIANLEFEGCKFDVSDIFEYDKEKLKKLEYIGFDFGTYPRSQVKKLFRKLPGLVCASYKRELFVKSTESIESVLSFEKHFEFFNTISYLKIK